MLSDWFYIYETCKDAHPSKFFNSIISRISPAERKKFTFIIVGRGGPTGKSWLCRSLDSIGCKAIELCETALYSYIDFKYTDDKNHYNIDYDNKLVTIILNKPLPKEVKPKKMTVSEINKALGYPVEIVEG